MTPRIPAGALAFLVLCLVLLLAACASAPAATTETPEPEPTTSPTATPKPMASATPQPDPVFDSYLHDAPELEALLPAAVAGRPLTRWSVRGINYFGGVGGLTDDELATLEADLATEGFTLDDFSGGTAGRSDPSDPPYIIHMLHVRGVPATDLPLGTNLDHAEAGDFEQVMIGGKRVWRGDPEMTEQSEHSRGTPYVYLSGEYLFTIVTEDETWAADALAQLP